MYGFNEQNHGFLPPPFIAFKPTFLVASGEPCLVEQGLPCAVPATSKTHLAERDGGRNELLNPMYKMLSRRRAHRCQPGSAHQEL